MVRSVGSQLPWKLGSPWSASISTVVFSPKGTTWKRRLPFKVSGKLKGMR
jgi:hypothetical protein